MSENYPPGWKLTARSYKDRSFQEVEVTDPIRKNLDKYVDRIAIGVGLIAISAFVCYASIGAYGLYQSLTH